jgi:hypothetical protein
MARRTAPRVGESFYPLAREAPMCKTPFASDALGPKLHALRAHEGIKTPRRSTFN